MPPEPTPLTLLTQWTLQPFAAVAVLAAAAWYLRARRRLRAGAALPGATGRAARSALPSRRQAAVFALGLVLLTWTTCGFPAVYGRHLFWVWTSQLLALLLVVPLVLLYGRPVELARGDAPQGRTARLLASRPLRALGSPLVGPALVPLMSGLLFFGPLPGWSVQVPAVGWLVQLAVVTVGAVVVLPLVGAERPRSSLAAGLALAIGSFELVIDAVPGFALRLHRHVATSWFDRRGHAGWLPLPLHDQQLAGGILWTVAELIDLPFLILIFRQWVQADARDAAAVDAVLEAERAARGPSDEPEELATDQPWWLSDPAMQDRLRKRG